MRICFLAWIIAFLVIPGDGHASRPDSSGHSANLCPGWLFAPSAPDSAEARFAEFYSRLLDQYRLTFENEERFLDLLDSALSRRSYFEFPITVAATGEVVRILKLLEEAPVAHTEAVSKRIEARLREVARTARGNVEGFRTALDASREANLIRKLTDPTKRDPQWEELSISSGGQYALGRTWVGDQSEWTFWDAIKNQVVGRINHPANPEVRPDFEEVLFAEPDGEFLLWEPLFDKRTRFFRKAPPESKMGKETRHYEVDWETREIRFIANALDEEGRKRIGTYFTIRSFDGSISRSWRINGELSKFQYDRNWNGLIEFGWRDEIVLWRLSDSNVVSRPFARIRLPGEESPMSVHVDGKNGRLILAGSMGNVSVIDLPKNPSATLMEGKVLPQGHSKPVTALHARWDLQRAVSGSSDRELRIWDLTPGSEKLLKVLSGAKETPYWIKTTPDFKIAVSGSGDSDGEIIVWDLQNGEILWRKGNLSETRMSPDLHSVIGLQIDGKEKVIVLDLKAMTNL